MLLAALGLFGASLFFGDSMITPAISVLSAVEGLKVISPDFRDFIVPITAVIIVALFSVQRHGTAAVGRFFGPVMIVWFLSIGACGVAGIVGNPEILKALSPTYALTFLVGPLPHRVLLPSRDRVVRHRRRGTVCRHGALRPQVHHLRLARPRAARVHAELLRSGCAGAGRRVEDYPLYRLEWQTLGSLQRRLRNCLFGMRAVAYPYGAPEYVNLELYLMWRARGMPVEISRGAAVTRGAFAARRNDGPKGWYQPCVR